MKKLIVCAIIISLAVMGCATNTQTGGLVGAGTGAAVGALVGQAAGRSTGATLLGAAIGAAVGGLAGTAIGHYMDKQEASMRQALANSEAASIQREQEVLQTAQRDATKKTVDVLTVTYNQKLSERRAESVKNALVGLGIQPQRISTIGYGFTKPIADNKTEAGRLQNRRVELRIIPIETAQR